MGIKGIYNEIGPGQRIALSKLAVETYENKGRPLRIAIDISIWLFQIQAGKGGSNPALRTFYYRLLRLISLAIHPLFVFDGPNKPPFKRNKRTGPNVASIPEFLAKQLLKQFGLPIHLAPGEAEAECALLQRKGIVDAVLSEDVDTLMFGSGMTLRNWSAEGTVTSKTPTHVNLYDAQVTKAGSSGLDREGMILVALMSGGDYIPEGIPGCGPKTACEAARAGFGADLCKIGRRDRDALGTWKERLCHELKTNESKHFKQKHKALIIPEDFPRSDILGYYTRPVVSSDEKVERLRETLKWDHDIDMVALRTFCAEAFDWTCISGAKKFVRNLAPALLVKSLRLQADQDQPSDPHEIGLQESRLIKSIYKQREHVTTDNILELRVGYIPINLVNIDLDAEEPDPESSTDDVDSEEDIPVATQMDGDMPDGDSTSPRKKRAPSQYDPTQLEKIWVLETYVKVGIPMKVQDWEEAHRNAKQYEAMKILRKRAEKKPKKASKATKPQASMTQFTKVTKPGQCVSKLVPKSADSERVVPLSYPSAAPRLLEDNVFRASRRITPPQALEPSSLEGSERRRRSSSGCREPPVAGTCDQTSFTSTRNIIDLLSSSPPAEIVTSQRSQRRSMPDTTASNNALDSARVPTPPFPQRGDGISNALSPSSTLEKQELFEALPELPPSVSTRRKRSPLRRIRTVPNAVTESQTPLAKRRNTFRVPASIPPSPSAPQDLEAGLLHTSLTSLHPKTAQLPSNAPSTPSRKHSLRPRPETPKQSQVITLSSSPQTPTRSSQKSIKFWLVSPSEPPLASPSPSQHRRPNGPPLKLAERTANIDKRDAPQTAAWKQHKARRRMIRLRESLEGGGAVNEWEDELALRSVVRRGHGEDRGRKRLWRYSEVETLDLTVI